MTEPEPSSLMRSELALVDEALATGTASASAATDRELQELALALAAEAEAPSPEFAAELGSRVRDGFPRRRPPSPRALWARLRSLRWPPAIALAGTASVIVAVAVVVGLQRGEDDGEVIPAVGERSDSAAQPARERALGGEADSSAPSAIAPEPPPGGPGFAPGERRRRIERSASLTLAAPADRLDRVADGVVRLTDRYGGFVLRSSLSTGDEGTTGGEFDLRIPAERLQAALGGLSKLADVRSRTQSGQDVTREFVSAEDRLEAARAERRSLLRRLESAPSDAAAEAIRRRLDLNAGEIRGLRAQVRDLRTRTSYAAVSVSLQADGEREGASPGSDDGLGGAVDDALASLEGSVEILVRVLGVAIPLGLLGVGFALGARALRRRRREAALS